MLKYAFDSNPKKTARAYGRSLRISPKNSVIICSAVTGKPLDKGKSLLEDLVSRKRNLRGRYYTNTSKEILEMIKSAENNAEAKGLNTERLFIHASAHKGFSFWRPRAFKMRGQHRKSTNIQVVLEQR
jgi:large subunit ribosomal protein L22